MQFANEVATSRGVEERAFSLDVQGREVPGLLWCSEAVAEKTPLVLIAHGGGDHKRAPYVLAVARLLVRLHGISACAIDGPGHGDRRPKATFRSAWREHGMTDQVVTEWRATLDCVSEFLVSGNTGFWGLSMGSMTGIPLLARERRISAAVLGLMGFWGPNQEVLERDAADVLCAVRFLLQWDDEVVPRATSFDLFDAIGAKNKSLHAHPGLHAAVPPEEVRASVGYLAQRLLS